MQKISSDILRLEDIIRFAREIEIIGKRDLKENANLFAAAYCVAVVGEAANKLSADLKSKHPNVPWTQIIGMRHKIIHEYGKLDAAILVDVIINHIPELGRNARKILLTMEPENPLAKN